MFANSLCPKGGNIVLPSDLKDTKLELCLH